MKKKTRKTQKNGPLATTATGVALVLVLVAVYGWVNGFMHPGSFSLKNLRGPASARPYAKFAD